MPFHQKIFLALILLLPTQLAYHFWPDSAFVFGIRVDYLAPTIYLTDILVVLLLAAWAYETRSKFKVQNAKFKITVKNLKYFLLITFYLLLNSFLVAQNQPAALFKLIKLAELFLLGFYVSRNWQMIIGNWKFTAALSAAVLYTSLIGIGQFLFGRTLGGPLWFLGERTFDATAPGIATQTVAGQEFLRAYSTFSHPNSFAGFLLLALLLLTAEQQALLNRRQALLIPWKGFLNRATLIIGLVALSLTFSQGAWFATVLVFGALIWEAWHGKVPKWLAITLLLVPVALTLSALLVEQEVFGNLSREEVLLRLNLAAAAREMILAHPLWGIGLNNFVVYLPKVSEIPQVAWWLQPAHNIFLLIAAETGIIGFLPLLWGLWEAFKTLVSQKKLILSLALSGLLITGSLDHYWWTLQQNQLLGAILLGLIFKD